MVLPTSEDRWMPINAGGRTNGAANSQKVTFTGTLATHERLGQRYYEPDYGLEM